MSKASKNTSHRKLYTVGSDAPFQYVEAYKSLRTNLEFLSTSGNCKTILITSSVPEEGKSNVAVNLAMTLTASGNRVVLVDCDLRKATISRYLRIPRNHAGLTNVITSKDEGALAAALVRVKDSGITVLTAGTIPPNPTELLSTPMTEKIFASCRRHLIMSSSTPRLSALSPTLRSSAALQTACCWSYAPASPPFRAPSSAKRTWRPSTPTSWVLS